MEKKALEDHVSLGKRLDYFIQEPIVGKGLPLLTPKGTALKRVLQRYVEEEEIRRGYEYTCTPIMADHGLYEISGHWDLYRDNMFSMESGEGDRIMALRPVTCPHQFYIYKRKQHSYRDMPVRLAETSTLFRKELSGNLYGIIRTFQFTLSEGHIICRPDQVEEEFKAALDLNKKVLNDLGIKKYRFCLSLKGNSDDSKYIQDPEAWRTSEALLLKIAQDEKLDYFVEEGEAAIYGPKLDIQTENVWGKVETLLTVQIDFALAGRFGMTYMDADGLEQHPRIIHRSSIGCFERTMAYLLEQYQGALPFWLSPEQVRIIPVSDKYADYANTLRTGCLEAGIRPSVDNSNNSMGRKIRDAHRDLVPVIIVAGENEAEAGTVTVNLRNDKHRHTLPQNDFLVKCGEWNRSHASELTIP